MKVIRNLIKPLVKEHKDTVFQTRALLKQDKLEMGKEKVLAPKHPTDEKHFKEAQRDTKIREELARKRDDVIENVNKITIKSFDPPEKPKSNRPLPSKDDQLKDHPMYEYCFYEPPLDKMQPGKLMFREAMELLQAKMEIELEGSEAENAKKVLESHPATKRVSAEDIDLIYEYFRPFVRKDEARYVYTNDLQILADYMNNRPPFDQDLIKRDILAPIRDIQERHRNQTGRHQNLRPEVKKKLIEGITKQRFAEKERLKKHLQEFTDIDPEGRPEKLDNGEEPAKTVSEVAKRIASSKK